MGQVSKKLAARFRKAMREAGKGGRPKLGNVAEDLHDMQELVESGYDPLHAAYIQAQNFVSFFAESVSLFKELDEYSEIAGSAEDDYLPQGPPISPLTLSYFTTWAFFDLQFGPDRETIGTCLLDLADVLDMDEFQVEVFRNYQQSRMGIYEHSGRTKGKVRLRELVTGNEFRCHSTSGYQGKKGELWFVRLGRPLPSLAGVADYHVVLTTPYVLMNFSKDDWTAYLKKNLAGSAETEQGLYEFMKFGPTPRHWPEFVFQAYHHHQYDAIFLAGLPDVKGSRPNAD